MRVYTAYAQHKNRSGNRSLLIVALANCALGLVALMGALVLAEEHFGPIPVVQVLSPFAIAIAITSLSLASLLFILFFAEKASALGKAATIANAYALAISLLMFTNLH